MVGEEEDAGWPERGKMHHAVARGRRMWLGRSHQRQRAEIKHIILAMGAAGNRSNSCSSHVGGGDDKSMNAKLLPDFTADELQVDPINDDSYLTRMKQQHSWSSVQAFVIEHIASEDLDLDWSREVVGLNGFQNVGWNDLREIALYCLHVFFKTAVEMLSHEGYTEDSVIHAIADSALCYQFDGPITKIADNARALLHSGQQVDSSLSENVDTHLHMLGLYILSYASSLLKKYFPFFTWSDALWCILLCDMDISVAHAFSVNMGAYGNGQAEGFGLNNQYANEPSGGYGYRGIESPGGRALFHSDKAQRVWSNPLTDYIVSIQKSAGKDQVVSGHVQVASSGQIEKSSSFPRTVIQNIKKETEGTSSTRSLVDSPRDSGKKPLFESFQQVKGYGRTSSRKLKENKSIIAFLESSHSTLAGTSKVASTKGLISSTCVPTLPLCNLSTVKRLDAVVSTLPCSCPVSHSCSSSSSGKTGTKQQTKPDCLVHFSLPITLANGCEFYFSRDGMQTTWVPKDRREELSLALIQRLGELKLEMKVWTDWANERVMQSTRRLAKEKTVLLSLQKEKEVEECGVHIRKKLEETQRAIDNTSDELERANSLAMGVTDKISLCKLEKEAAKLQQMQSDGNFADILRKENESLERLKSMEREKIFLQAELAAERSNLSELLKNLQQAKGYEDLLKILQKSCQEGEKMADEALKQVYFERNELERIDILERTEYNLLLLSAQNEKQRLQSSVKQLNQHVGERLELHQSVAKVMTPPGFEVDSVQREQECVMCLEEEISVVFLPCRHQIVCVGCSQLHQDQGMTDCPSCRTPIKRRISARFADS